MVVVTPVSICDVVRAECLMCTVYIEFHTLLHTLLVIVTNYVIRGVVTDGRVWVRVRCSNYVYHIVGESMIY